MPLLQLTYAPDPIFKQKAAPVAQVTDETRQLVDDMFETMEFEQAVGMGANMVGVLQRIAVIDLHEGGISKPYCFINPTITWRSEETQTHDEASICFIGISAPITRPNSITVEYLDYDGAAQTLTAEGFFASVIQHELDYLDGVTFLDHLSTTKRDMLLRKMKKLIRANPPHIHGEHCNH